MNAPIDKNSYRLVVPVAALLLALSTPVVLADDHGHTNTYNYAQLHALQAEYADIPGFSLRGAEVRAGFSVGQVFGELRYRDTVDKPGASQLDEDRWNISLGYAFPARNRTHFDLRLNYGELNLDGRSPGGNLVAGIDYFGVSGFVHHQLSGKWRVYAGLEQQNWQGWSTQKAYHLGTMYKLGWASLGAEYIKYSDSDSISMFLRYEF
jgi:hypothetical protein